MSTARPSNLQLATLSSGAGRAKSSGAVQDLENSIAGFHAILTDEDRKGLQRLKGASHDAQSIITFTADLDRRDKNRRGKSVASRLASFLQTIEQFTPVVDTYIQSNPNLAALIWGSVKLTFMVLSNFTSYFQSFVELLYGFGLLCSRFADYQVLFDNPRLKDSVCQFHTTVITCCEKILIAIRRPLKDHVWKAVTQSFQAELRGFVEDIRRNAENVQGEIDLAKAQADHNEQQLQGRERHEAAEHRKSFHTWVSTLRNDTKALELQRKRSAGEKDRRRLINELSSYDHNLAFNNARNKRHNGTADWAFRMDEFRAWRKSKESAVLHITGKIGSGKTILASSIVEKLCQRNRTGQFISFLFLRFDDFESLVAQTIIRSCVQQLLSAVLMDGLDEEVAFRITNRLEKAKRARFSLDSLASLYVAASQATKDWFIILDGLDECDQEQQSRLFKFFSGVLGKLPTVHRIKILFSSRETISQTLDHCFPNIQRIRTGTDNTSTDIIAFAEDVINTKLESGELVVGNLKIIDEILDIIKLKEEGMFLWAFLTIQDICSRKTDREIRQTLQDIPTDLPRTFDRALGRIIQHRHQKIAKKTFAWTTAAYRPLTLPQLREALSIKPGQQDLHPDDLVSGIERVILWCENLVCIEETDNTVHFSHHSIHEYLLSSGSGDFPTLHVDIRECDQLAGEICITYLGLDTVNSALPQGTDRASRSAHPVALNIEVGQVASRTVQDAFGGSIGAHMSRVAKRALRSKDSSHPSQEVNTVSIHVPSPSPGLGAKTKEKELLGYASEYFFRHPTLLDNTTNAAVWKILGRVLRNPWPTMSLPWMDLTWRSEVMRSFRKPDSLENPPRKVMSLLEDETPSGTSPRPVDLAFAFIYASQRYNWGLACRVLMLLAEEARRVESLLPTAHYLAITEDHIGCPNRCSTLLEEQYPNHATLVETVTEAVADGVNRWPVSENEHPVSCDCRMRSYGLQDESCRILTTGYDMKAAPHLRVFAKVALYGKSDDDDKLTPTEISFKGLCQQYQGSQDSLLRVRTQAGKSLVDILVEHLPPHIQFRHVSVSGFNSGSHEIEEIDPFQSQAGHTVLLLLALRRGLYDNVNDYVHACVNGRILFPLHKETVANGLSDAIKLLRSAVMRRDILRILIAALWPPVEHEDFNEDPFLKLTRKQRWNQARSMINVPPNRKQTQISRRISILARTLLCDPCTHRLQPLGTSESLKGAPYTEYLVTGGATLTDGPSPLCPTHEKMLQDYNIGGGI